MALVDPKILEALSSPRNSALPPPNPTLANMSVLDTEMRHVLDSDQSDGVKVQAYNQILQRYLFQQTKHVDSSPQLRPKLFNDHREGSNITSLKVKETKEDIKLDPVEIDLLDSIPKTFLNKAHLLMRRLRNHPDLQWNEKGEVTLKGQHFPASNLADLVNDVLRNRKNMPKPLAWREFASHLQDMNIPQEIVGNKARLPFIKGNALSTPPGEPAHPLTSRSTRSKTRPKRQRSPYYKWSSYND